MPQHNARTWWSQRICALKFQSNYHVVLLTIGIAFCGVISSAPKAAADSEAAIVVAGPRDGPFAARTSSIKRGVSEAAAIIATSPGERPLKIIEIDDGCNALTAVEAAEQAVALKPVLVLGHPCTAAALAAAEVYARASILFIATATRHPALTLKRAGPTIYRLSGRDDAQGADTARHLANLFAGKRITIVHDQTQYATALAADVGKGLAASGLSAPAAIVITAGELDYRASVMKVVEAQPAAIYFAGFPIEAGILVRELRRQGVRAIIYLNDAAATSELIETFGNDTVGLRTFRARLLPAITTVNPPAASSRENEIAKQNTDLMAAKFAVLAWAAASKDEDSSQHSSIPTDADFARTGIIFDSLGDVSWPSFTAVEWNGKFWVGTAKAEQGN